VFFSFLTRFFSSKPNEILSSEAEENTALKIFVIKEGGKFFHPFKLFHRDTVTLIDTLIFLPHFGIFLGETISWNASELENATVERSSRLIKHPPSTRFESMESKIRQKLEDVLSFDSTPIERFIWMKNLTEAEFDALDPTFHELLPKTRLFFKDESGESVKNKLYVMGVHRDEPLSSLKIIGALNSHTYILPTPKAPTGAILSPEQNNFLSVPLTSTTTLYGDYGSGKSTLILRKAILMLLDNPKENILIISPTLLASELLRDEFVSLLEYGALSIDLNRITFSPAIENIDEQKFFHDATLIMCDDAYLLKESFRDRLKRYEDKRTCLYTTVLQNGIPENSVLLFHRYRNHIHPRIIPSAFQNTRHLLLAKMRSLLLSADKNEIMIVFTDPNLIDSYKEALDEYLGLNCRIVTSSFSLQSQNLDNLILTTSECIGGLSISHLFLITQDDFEDYTFILSRASETSTIISYPNPNGESHE